MNAPSKTETLWLAAIAALLAGAVMTWHTVLHMREQADIYKRKTSVITALNDLALEIEPFYAAEKSYSRIAGRPVPFETFAKSALPDVPHETRQVSDNSSAVADGWKLRRHEISFSEAPVDKVIDFALRAESLNPPWRAAQCEIRALAGRPNMADIVITFEVPEKQQ